MHDGKGERAKERKVTYLFSRTQVQAREEEEREKES